MQPFNHIHIETLAVHAGEADEREAGAVMPPIHLSTTFERGADGGYPSGFVYARSDNPNRQALERALATLEGGEVAVAFASGMAAIMAVFQSLARGAHLILPDDVYFGARALARGVFARWGLAVSTADMTDPDAVARQVRPETGLIWVETPSNPMLKIADIAAIAPIAHEAGAICACDNTWPSPVLQQPLSLGADLVVHSTTKYLGGHSDLVGGAVIAREDDELFARIRTIQTIGGAIPSPFDCWLLMRSLRTLPYRIRAHSQNARQVAAYLADHPAVARVHYPGLADHPGHAIAARQMRDFGGMLSVQMKGGAEAARRLANRVRLFTQATSLGGVESLIEHRASVEGPNSTTPDDLLRLSIGLEHPDDLIADLEQAMG